MNLSDVWCAYQSDSLPLVNLNFTESVYLLFAVFRGGNSNYVTSFSMTYKNPSGENVTYMTINGGSVRHFNAFMNNYYVFYRFLDFMIALVFIIFCCGNRSVLVKYNSMFMGMKIFVVVLG